MSLEIIYSARSQKHKWRFSDHEVEALEILASKDLKEKIYDIIGVSDFGEVCHINRDKLYNAVAFVAEGIERETIPLPLLFDVKVEIPRGSGNYSTGGTANLTVYTRYKALSRARSIFTSPFTPPFYCIDLHRIAKVDGNLKHEKMLFQAVEAVFEAKNK